MATTHERSRWRARARQVIAGVMAENAGMPVHLLRKIISAAYPFGPRNHHPYRIWLSEVRRAIGPSNAPKEGPLITLTYYGTVWCRHCSPKPTNGARPAGGCIACFRAEEWSKSLPAEKRKWIAEMLASGTEKEFRKAVLRDWLAENGPGGIEV